ncbi:MAG: hypothetical protein ACPGOV_10615 [Magnetovibrionaceae bacterium]
MTAMVDREEDRNRPTPTPGAFARDMGLASLRAVDDRALLQAVATGGPLGVRVDTLAITKQYSLGEVAARIANFVERGYVMELRDQIRMSESMPNWPWVRLTPKGAVQLGYLVRCGGAT